MHPDLVVITGLDDQTNLDRVAAISARYPVEWGILFSPEAQGLHPRFPSMETVSRVIANRRRLGLRTAAHLCGGHAKAIMDGAHKAVMLPGFSRVQVNHARPDPDALDAFARANPTLGVIAQWRDPTSFPAERRFFSWLYDLSGGRGEAPTAWPTNPTAARVGYAGGIDPDTVATVLATVAPLSPAGYWLDMESGVRTDDRLDLDKVERVLAAAFDGAALPRVTRLSEKAVVENPARNAYLDEVAEILKPRIPQP